MRPFAFLQLSLGIVIVVLSSSSCAPRPGVPASALAPTVAPVGAVGVKYTIGDGAGEVFAANTQDSFKEKNLTGTDRQLFVLQIEVKGTDQKLFDWHLEDKGGVRYQSLFWESNVAKHKPYNVAATTVYVVPRTAKEFVIVLPDGQKVSVP